MTDETKRRIHDDWLYQERQEAGILSRTPGEERGGFHAVLRENEDRGRIDPPEDEPEVCLACNGDGHIRGVRCVVCKGTGEVTN